MIAETTKKGAIPDLYKKEVKKNYQIDHAKGEEDER